MELILHNLSKQNGSVLVCGNFNVNYMADSHRRRQMDKLLCSFNLSSIITFPTRIGSNTATGIDMWA
jgi:hypothetical protein